MVKYGVRHYGHTVCLLKEKGEQFILSLTPGQPATVSVLFLSKKGRTQLMERYLADAGER